eukprot:scaffold37870_cov54-Phaeocystis_antarctica.AAC.1
MPPSRPRAASNEHVPEYAPCWGAELHGGVGCLPHFVPGKLHFKNNFCDNCRDCVMVPISQVCANPNRAYLAGLTLTAYLAGLRAQRRAGGVLRQQAVERLLEPRAREHGRRPVPHHQQHRRLHRPVARALPRAAAAPRLVS